MNPQHEVSQEFRLQAVGLGNNDNRLKAELHTYFACSVINSEPILQLHLLLFLKSPCSKDDVITTMVTCLDACQAAISGAIDILIVRCDDQKHRPNNWNVYE